VWEGREIKGRGEGTQRERITSDGGRNWETVV
jgi:hypothetical protein